jgi:DNA-binding MarR family transcriptional regulator
MTTISTTTAAAAEAAEQDLGPRLRLGIMRLARRLRQQSEGDVTASMLSALSTIDSRGPITLGALAGVERISPPSMTRIVTRLEERALVTRVVDAADRRVARVSTTAAGRKLLQQNRTRKNAYLAAKVRNLSADERALLQAALPVLERLVEDE